MTQRNLFQSSKRCYRTIEKSIFFVNRTHIKQHLFEDWNKFLCVMRVLFRSRKVRLCYRICRNAQLLRNEWRTFSIETKSILFARRSLSSRRSVRMEVISFVFILSRFRYPSWLKPVHQKSRRGPSPALFLATK
jgi:hypothetical protein